MASRADRTRRDAPDPERDRRRAPMAPQAPAERVLELQRSAGNAQVSRALLQRFGTRMPHTPSAVKAEHAALEKAIKNDDRDGARRAAEVLFRALPGFFVDVVLAKLGEAAHTSNGDLWDAYFHAPPQRAKVATLIVACEREDIVVAPRLCELADFLTAGERLKLARTVPSFFLRAILVPLRSGPNPGFFATLMQDHAMREALRAGAPEEFAMLANQAPQVGVVEEVRQKADDGASEEAIVDGLFAAILAQRGISVAYYVTAPSRWDVVVAGDSSKRAAARERQRTIEPNLPTIPAADCHNLTTAFETIVKSYPGLSVMTERKTAPNAVLTGPLAGVPGGLLKQFAGNVFGAGGAPLGRIFFSGAAGSVAHSWLQVTFGGRKKDYDILFGTTGPAVRAFATEYVAVGEGVYRAGDEYIRADDALVAPANPYGFRAGYRAP
jgi:hypothetical protein